MGPGGDLETTVSIVGGVGLFLLGMAVMTDGLKALAGTALKTVLEKAAATPLLGTFWGAIITLLVQSSSATTMTTIGLVSAGLLTFPQGLSLVFGANIGTTGTGWLVAAFGVRISLTAAALPIVFVGALMKVVGRGRLAAAGAAIAGFALILVGLIDAAAGHGRACRILAPIGPAHDHQRRRRDRPARASERAAAGRGRRIDDHRHAVFDRLDRGDALGPLCRRGRPRSGARARHRPEHRHRDLFGRGRDRRLEHRQAPRCRLYRLQAGGGADRDRALSVRDAADRPGVADHRCDGPACRPITPLTM